MTDASYLQNSVVNLAVLRDHARNELLDCLDAAGSTPKCVVLDPSVGLLSIVADVTLLKKHGVEQKCSLYGDLETHLSSIVYFVRPCIESMKYIVSHVKANQRKMFSVFFIPRRTMLCEDYLKEEGVYGNLFISEYHLDLLPLDSDVLSLEYNNSYQECALDGDLTSLFYVARSLMKMQSLFGLIPHIIGKGQNAEHVADMLKRMRKEQVVGVGLDDNFGGDVQPEIDTLILIDREVDMVTPFCTQLTYEGLISEVFGVHQGHVSVPVSMVPVELVQQLPKNKTHFELPLNSGDNVYEEVRDFNFSRVGPWVKVKAKRVNEEYEERHAAKTLHQIRDFVSKLKGIQEEHRSLQIHTNIAGQINKSTSGDNFLGQLQTEQMFVNAEQTDRYNEYIEDCICRQDPMLKSLRLMCLQSVTNGGLKQKVLDQYMREFLQTYGYEHVRSLYNLQRLNLFCSKLERRRYDIVKKNLNLVVDEVDEANPKDISYVYSGYAPISVRLVEHLRHSSWKSIENVLAQLPGPHFEIKQSVNGQRPKIAMKVGGSGKKDSRSKVSLVFFLGGCTSTEISAVRFLNKRLEGHEYIVATTSIITGDSLLSTILNPIPVSEPMSLAEMQSYTVGGF